jgi:hypothetical protein
VRAGQEIHLAIALAHWPEHKVKVVVRWASPSVVGVEILEPSPEATKALSRYVSELLARGASS